MDHPSLKDVLPFVLARKSTKQILAVLSCNRYLHLLATEEFWKKIILIRWDTFEGKLKPAQEHFYRYRQDCERLACVDEAVFQSILARGIDLEARDKYDNTLLMDAILNSRVILVERLISAGADVNAYKKNGLNVLLLACLGHGCEYYIEILIKAGVNVNNVDRSDGRTALFCLIDRGFIEEVDKSFDLLIKAGINVNTKNKAGETALHYIFRRRSKCGQINTTILQKLIDAGADLNSLNKLGQTPLILCCMYDNESIARQLLQAGAKLDIVDDNGLTAMDYLKYFRT